MERITNYVKKNVGHTSKNILSVFIIQGLIAGVGLLTNIFIARLFGAEALGIYSYFFSLVVIIAVISVLGFQNSVPVLIKKNPSWTSSLLKKTVFYSTLSSVAITTLVLMITSYFKLNPSTPYFYFAVYLYIIFWVGYAILSNAVSAYNRFNLASSLSLRVRIIFILLILLIVIFTKNIEYVLICFGISVIVSIPYLWWKIRRIFPSTNHPMNNFDLFYASIPFLLQSISIFFIYHGDRFVINYFLSFGELANYSAYSSLISAIRLLSGVFSLVLTPLAVTNTYHIKKSFSKLLLFLLPLSTIILIVSIYFVPLLYGSEYHEEILLPLSMTISSILLVIYSYFNALYLGEESSKGKISIMIIDVLLSTLFNLFLNAALIPIYGLVGAALATSMTLIIKILLNVYALRNLRAKKTPFHEWGSDTVKEVTS